MSLGPYVLRGTPMSPASSSTPAASAAYTGLDHVALEMQKHLLWLSEAAAVVDTWPWWVPQEDPQHCLGNPKKI